jgi:hypothetical protein
VTPIAAAAAAAVADSQQFAADARLSLGAPSAHGHSDAISAAHSLPRTLHVGVSAVSQPFPASTSAPRSNLDLLLSGMPLAAPAPSTDDDAASGQPLTPGTRNSGGSPLSGLSVPAAPGAHGAGGPSFGPTNLADSGALTTPASSVRSGAGAGIGLLSQALQEDDAGARRSTLDAASADAAADALAAEARAPAMTIAASSNLSNALRGSLVRAAFAWCPRCRPLCLHGVCAADRCACMVSALQFARLSQLGACRCALRRGVRPPLRTRRSFQSSALMSCAAWRARTPPTPRTPRRCRTMHPR